MCQNGEIYIDDGTDNVRALPAEIMEAIEVSGDGPNAIGGTTTDDEDLIPTEGSGNNLVDPAVSFSPTSKVTTMNNDINENTGGNGGPTISNGIGPIYDEDGNVRYKNGNDALGAGPNDVNEEPQNFFKMIFENPAILAGMVGAVVLILLTVVLLFLFVIYRIKKKDEGSYSLDEPHKVKDPTAYWKDTKEFYA
ncbi:syndecan-like [Lytechinus pictus]|uniref:syndecan-like n=1 Tax=Lytechinus pictus TaxID=7653 RepID=UPI0030B9CC64